MEPATPGLQGFFKLLMFFCDCTEQFVPNLFGIANCWFSHAKAQIIIVWQY